MPSRDCSKSATRSSSSRAWPSRERRGKVLIDWSQNDAHKTTVSVYSLRATERPSVSTPVDWAEVTECRDRGEPGMLSFGPDDVLTRVAGRGDLFAKIWSLQQTLPRLEE